jgi:PKD repeat protein
MRYFIVAAFFFVNNLVHAQSFSFAQAPGSPITVPTTTGSNRCLLSYDLNSDGKKDLMLGNAYDTEITIFHGTGGGQYTIAPVSPINVGNGPINFLLSDFNNDAIKDLAIAKYLATNQIAVFNGMASGNYTQAAGSPYATGNQPYWIDAADFNLDGNIDIVTCNFSGGTTYVYLGNGASSFSIAAGYPITTSSGPVSSKTGYFNNDNFPDYAVLCKTTNLMRVMLGNGTGSFTAAPGSPFSTSGAPSTFNIKDLNNDGYSDMVVAGNSGSVNVFMGSANGTFTQAPGSPFAVSTDLYEAAIADYDFNGTYDLAVSGASVNNVFLFSGNGNGTFSAATPSVITGFSFPQSITPDDFNNDGRTDLGIVDWVGTNLRIYLNTSTVCPVNASYSYSNTGLGAYNFTSTSTGTVAGTTYSWNYGDATSGSGNPGSHTYTSNGTYTVTLSVNNNFTPTCVQSSSSVITVTNVCNIGGMYTYTNLANGQVQFSTTASGTNSTTTYLWDFGDANGSGSQNPSHIYANGTYTVILVIDNHTNPPCTQTITQVIIVNNSAVSVNELLLMNKVNVYPNPASDKLYIDIEGITPLNTQVIIFSAIGNEVLRYDLRSAKNEIKLDQLSNGFYYYNLRTNSRTIRTGQLILHK